MKHIGIDPGAHTGVAVWDTDRRALVEVATLPLHRALALVSSYAAQGDIQVTFEDARQRRWLPAERSRSEYRGHLMGAGSVKRDCTIWEEFCRDKRIPFTARAPQKGLTKWSAEAFARLTGWQGRTSDHARDAAMLVVGR